MSFLKVIPKISDFSAMKAWFDGDSDFSVEDIVNGEFLFIVSDQEDADHLEGLINNELNDNPQIRKSTYYFEFEED